MAQHGRLRAVGQLQRARDRRPAPLPEQLPAASRSCSATASACSVVSRGLRALGDTRTCWGSC
eukprot:15477983-Alexandrium_andersonii.AAC.1